MKIIPVTHGVGTGTTELAAFDNALLDAGIANFNLIYLSSIIPDGHEPKIEKIDLNNKKFGHKLYVVCAQERTSVLGETVAAGVGWVMNTTKPRHGLFVEHEGHSVEDVKALINHSLTRMIENRPGEVWGSIQHHVIETKCIDEPVCALVAAVYKSESW